MNWSLPLPTAVGQHADAFGLLRLTAATNADAAAVSSAKCSTAASEVVVAAARQLRTALSVFDPLADGDGHGRGLATSAVVFGVVADIFKSTLGQVDAFSATAVAAADYAKRTRELAAGYGGEMADDVMGDSGSSKCFIVDPDDEQTLVDARAAVDAIGRAYDLGMSTEERDAVVPDINAEAVAGLAMALSISRGIVISTKKDVDDALIQRDSTDAIHDQAVERTLRANAAVASAAAKIQDHLNRLDRRYGIAVDMQSDASRTAHDASDVNNNDRDMRLAVNTANVCLAVCNLKTQAARHAILVANETLREFDALGSAPVLDAQSSGDIEMCEVVDASNMA